MKRIQSLVLVSLIFVSACGSGNKSGGTQEQLNYDQTMALIFPDSTNVSEWHGAPLDKGAISFVSLSEGRANGDCGKEVMLTNSSDQDVKVTVSTVFPFTDSPWEVSKTYIVPAGTSKHVGNNRVCHNGDETSFLFKVQGATFNLEE